VVSSACQLIQVNLRHRGNAGRYARAAQVMCADTSPHAGQPGSIAAIGPRRSRPMRSNEFLPFDTRPIPAYSPAGQQHERTIPFGTMPIS
jgi:hypothetical protein